MSQWQYEVCCVQVPSLYTWNHVIVWNWRENLWITNVWPIKYQSRRVKMAVTDTIISAPENISSFAEFYDLEIVFLSLLFHFTKTTLSESTKKKEIEKKTGKRTEQNKTKQKRTKKGENSEKRKKKRKKTFFPAKTGVGLHLFLLRARFVFDQWKYGAINLFHHSFFFPLRSRATSLEWSSSHGIRQFWHGLLIRISQCNLLLVQGYWKEPWIKSFTEILLQLHLAITDLKGPSISFHCRWISAIVILRNEEKFSQGTKKLHLL